MFDNDNNLDFNKRKNFVSNKQLKDMAGVAVKCFILYIFHLVEIVFFPAVLRWRIDDYFVRIPLLFSLVFDQHNELKCRKKGNFSETNCKNCIFKLVQNYCFIFCKF